MALTQISTNGIKNNTITGTDLATNIDLVDNQKIRLGTGNDLQIYHDGTYNVLKGSSNQFFIENSANILFAKVGLSETYLKMIPDGAVELYYDNSKKLETTSTGIDVNGTVTADDIITAGALLHEGDTNTLVHFSAADTIDLKTNGTVRLRTNNSGVSLFGVLYTNGRNISLGDSGSATDDRITFGESQDLQIYHDGSNSYFANGTGATLITGSSVGNIAIKPVPTEDSILGVPNGNVQLYYDGSKKFETTSGGVQVTDNLNMSGGHIFLADNYKLNLGTGDDLQIYHSGSASYISDQGTGELILKSNSISFTNAAENEHLARFFQDSAVELYFNGSKKFHTKNAGVYITGDIETSGDFYMLDNEKIRIGHSQDLEIYHDSSSSVIKNLTNDLYVQSIADIKIRTNDSELAVDCTVNGSVALYYDASKKLETTSTGVTVTGDFVPEANDTRALGTGSLQWAQSNIRELKVYEQSTHYDNVKAVFGHGEDLQIYHDGSHSRIADIGTGILSISTNQCNIQNAAINENMAEFFENGAVNLYYDNGKKFETRSDGVKLSQGHFYADDHSRIKLGDGQDLELYHDGTNSSIKNTTGDLYIYDTGGNIYIQANTPEQSIIAFANGSTELYYDNSIRIRTQSYGIEYHNQQHKFMHTNSGGVGAYLSLMNPGTAAGGKTGVVFGIGNSNAILDGTDYGEGQIKCFTDSGYYGNLEFNLHVGANRSWMKIVGNGAGHTGAGAGTEGMRGGVAFGCAGIAIDRSWTGQPGIHVFNTNSEGDTDQGTFRFHGWNRSYASYPASSGSDFSVNLVADGSGLSSDKRRKTGIATITNALDTITKMRGVSFQFVNRELNPQTHMSMDNGKKLGFIAQEVIPLLPQLILDSGEKNVPLENGWCDRYSMDYSGVTAVLVEAIKELAAKVASLESKITE